MQKEDRNKGRGPAIALWMMSGVIITVTAFLGEFGLFLCGIATEWRWILIEGLVLVGGVIASAVLWNFAVDVQTAAEEMAWQEAVAKKRAAEGDWRELPPEQIFREKKESYAEHTKLIGIRSLRGEYGDAVFAMKPDEHLTMGTQAETCQVLFEDRKISRMHCVVSYRQDKGMYEVTDCSKNGTYWFNGERLPFGTACLCQSGTIFTIDHQKQVFQVI